MLRKRNQGPIGASTAAQVRRTNRWSNPFYVSERKRLKVSCLPPHPPESNG
jgi:hypothetical protein